MAIDVGTMVETMDPDGLCLVVNAVEKSVGATLGTLIARELAAERLADAARLVRHVAEGEFDDGGQDPRR